MEHQQIVSTELVRTSTEVLPVEGKHVIDNALHDLRKIEYSPDARNGDDSFFGTLEDKIKEVTPKIYGLGKKAMPYLVQKLRHPDSSDLPESVRNQMVDNPNLTNTELGRVYIATWIDGFADLAQIDQVMDALSIDRVINSNNDVAADILLGTVKRLIFPLRSAKENAATPVDTSMLDTITDRLITLYERKPKGRVAREGKTDGELLQTIALTGTEKAKAYLKEHGRELDNMPARLESERVLNTFESVRWHDFTHYQFRKELNRTKYQYRLVRDPVRDEEKTKLTNQARKIFGLPVEESSVVESVEQKSHSNEIEKMPQKLDEQDKEESTDVGLQHDVSDGSEAQVKVDGVKEDSQPSKSLGKKRTGLSPIRRTVAAEGFGVARLIDNTNSSQPIAPEAVLSAPAEADSLSENPHIISDTPVGIPNPPVLETPDSNVKTPDNPVTSIATEGVLPPPPYKENALESAPIDPHQEDSQPDAIPTTDREVPRPPLVENTLEATMPAENQLEVSPLSEKQEVGEDKNATTEEEKETIQTIQIGDHGATISENILKEAGKDSKWWQETYWYNPNNLGAFILVNYDMLSASYDARTHDGTPVTPFYPNGYPSRTELIQAIEQAQAAIHSLGIDSLTTDTIQKNSYVLNQNESLRVLWEATRLVRDTDSFTVPLLAQSEQIINVEKNK